MFISVQKLQFFLSETNRDTSTNAVRTLELLHSEPLIVLTPNDVIVLNDTGVARMAVAPTMSRTNTLGRSARSTMGPSASRFARKTFSYGVSDSELSK
jgi:hypothetical protein